MLARVSKQLLEIDMGKYGSRKCLRGQLLFSSDSHPYTNRSISHMFFSSFFLFIARLGWVAVATTDSQRTESSVRNFPSRRGLGRDVSKASGRLTSKRERQRKAKRDDRALYERIPSRNTFLNESERLMPHRNRRPIRSCVHELSNVQHGSPCKRNSYVLCTYVPSVHAGSSTYVQFEFTRQCTYNVDLRRVETPRDFRNH